MTSAPGDSSAYGEAIAQGCALRGAAVAHRSGQTSGKAILWEGGLDGAEGALAAEALVQVQGEPA